MSLEFVQTFKTQPKSVFLAMYDKKNIVDFLRYNNIDTTLNTVNNTKDELYKRLVDFFENQSNNSRGLRGG